MYRQIFVIDSTGNRNSSVIEALVHTPTCEQPSSNTTTQDFIDFDPYTRDRCVYLFTHATILNDANLNAKDQDLNLSIRKRLKEYFRNRIHLILFITKYNNLNVIAFENLHYMDDSICHQKIPVICIVDGWNNMIIHRYLQRYQNVLLNTKYDGGPLTFVQDLWTLIETESLEPSVEPRNHFDHTNKKPDTNLKDQSTWESEVNHPQTGIESLSLNKQKDRVHNDFASESKAKIVSAIFNETNTNVKNLMNRCEQYQGRDYQHNCVLLTTGSLNPVHRAHIRNLELVKKYLKHSTLRWNVLAGYLSPTHDSYVRGKLGKATIPSHDRCDLCELAIREHEHETHTPHWLSVSRAECEYQQGFVDFGPTTVALSQYLNALLLASYRFVKYPLYVVYVCGLDHFNKCPAVRRLAKEKYIMCAVIYRKNSDEQQISELDESSNIIYVPLDDERMNIVDISSTEIRRRWESSPHELTQFTYVSVINRLKAMKFHF